MSQYSNPARKYLKVCCCVQSHSPREHSTQRTQRARMGFLKSSLLAQLLPSCIQKVKSYLCSSPRTNSLFVATLLPVSVTSSKWWSSVPVFNRTGCRKSQFIYSVASVFLHVFLPAPINSHQNNLHSVLICTFNLRLLASLEGTK